MQEIKMILKYVENNNKLLRVISDKQDQLFKKLDELEGKVCARTTNDRNSGFTPPDSDTELLEGILSKPRPPRSISFSDSESDNDGDIFKDAIQIPPTLAVKEKDDFTFDFDLESGVGEKSYSGSIYYGYAKNECKRVASIKCRFRKTLLNKVLEVVSADTKGKNVNFQIVCGNKDKGLYEMEVKKEYALVKVKPEAILNSKLDIRLILLKFSSLEDASEIYRRLCK
uniref:RanBD1 domain-containing protein n=1 Tax=Strongyloides venezuelensis TaxID=75913 RepID=A0A0K0FP57_STRVS